MSKEALLNVNQLAARKGAAELEFAVKKVHSLDASKGGPDGYLKAIERKDRLEKFKRLLNDVKIPFEQGDWQSIDKDCEKKKMN